MIMRNFKNFLMMGLLPLFGFALLASCGKDPNTDSGNDPQRPPVDKDSAIVLKQKTVTAAVSGGSYLLEYEITNPHQGEKISATAAEDWVSDFNTGITGALGFKVAANTGDTARETLVTVSYHYAEDVTFTVKQNARTNAGFTVEQVIGNGEYFSFTVNVSPDDKSVPYIVMSASPSYIDEFNLTTSEALYQDDFEYFKYLGTWHGMSAVEIMQDRAKMGNQTVTVGSAVPGETYVFYCYYFDYESGALLSEVERFNITVEHPKVESISESYFTFSHDIQGPRVFTDVKSTTAVDYYYDVMSKAELDAAVSKGFTKESYIQQWWANIVANLCHKDGLSTAAIVAQNTCQGQRKNDVTGEMEDRSKWAYDLLANTTYYIFAFNMDANALCVTTPQFVEFTTGNVESSDNVITLTHSDVTSYRATVTVSATYEESEENYRHAYVIDIATKDEWNKFGKDDESRMNYIKNNIPLEYMWGDKTIGFTGLEGDTEYVVYAFGLYGGVVTTQLSTTTFKTKSSAPGEVDIDVTDHGYYDAADLAMETGLEFFGSDSFEDCVIVPIEITFSEKNHGDYFLEIYDWTRPDGAKRSDIYDDWQYTSGLLWQIETKGSYSTTKTYTWMKYNCYYTIVALVVDVNGQYSKLFKRDYNPTYDGVGEVADFTEWWYSWNSGGNDGPELSSLIVKEAAEAKADVIEIDASVSKLKANSYLKASQRTFEAKEVAPELSTITATR